MTWFKKSQCHVGRATDNTTQIGHYLKLAFEEAYKAGTKPINGRHCETILVVGLNDLELSHPAWLQHQSVS